ncbi:MAG: response regulator [Bacteroidota bacterium]
MSEEIKNVRILVVDDEYSNVELVLSIIDDLIQEVFYAPNGKVAIELTLEEKPDIIVMDWEMPEMNGIEAIREIKKLDEISSIPIIVATGLKTTDENLREALDAGATDFLRKPYSTIEFKARVSSALRIQQQHQTIQKMLEESIEQKQRELTSMATLDFQKSALLNDLLNQVGRLDRITNFVYATDIKEIQKQLKSQLDLDKSWDSFKIHFEETHTGFFDKLDKTFDSLSLNERKLCAYIKMGMGNFEICQMTGSSDAALRKAINRLKKKLDLGAKDDIRKFLFDF